MRIWQFMGYTVTCALSHQLLSRYYADACRPSWLFDLNGTPFCEFLYRTLGALRIAPLAPLLALPALRHGPAVQ